MAKTLSGFFAGALFGVGLALGGMTQPSKIIAFLDVAGDWDPTLMLVMGGAVAVYAVAYRILVRGERTPLFAMEFVKQTSSHIDAPLVVGAVLFGLGWGIGGYCPGPAIVSAGTGAPAGLTFVVAMLAGMVSFEGWQRLRERPPPRDAGASTVP